MRARLIFACLLPFAAAGVAAAAAPASIDAQRERLRAARTAAQAALLRSDALQAQAARADDAAKRAAAERAALEAKVDAAKADIISAGARVAIIDSLLSAQRERLSARQNPVARLLAALQSLACRPELFGIVQPGSLRDTVHVRAMLGTMVPNVEARTRAVRAGIERTRHLRGQAMAAVDGLNESRARLDAERLALVRLEAEHRLRSRALARGALTESDRAIAMGERARELVAAMDVSADAAEIAARLAMLPGPLPRPVGDAGAIRLPAAPNAYRLPVEGRLVTGTGEISPSGVRARGLSFAAEPGAAVIAPAAGTVVFARRFRGYGRIVIIDHGMDWSTLVTGLGEVAVAPGDKVAQGAPLGRVGAGDPAIVTVELRREGEPVDAAAMIG